jgi:uncharacterized protein
MAPSDVDLPPGMTVYVAGLFRRVEGRPPVSGAEEDRIQAEHLTELRKLLLDGKLIAAGPFLDDGPLRGLMIFAPGISEVEARTLLEGDAAIREGRLVLELRSWLGPAGLRRDPLP